MTRKKIFIAIFIIFIVLCIWAFWNGLIKAHYEISTDKIDGEIRLVLIADLHSHIFGENQKHMVSKINAEKPDLILLSGDIVDDVKTINGAEQFLNVVKDIAPVYYVTGNHEYWSGNIENIKSVISSYGVKILDNKYEEITVNGNSIIIGGVDDPESYNKRYSVSMPNYGSWQEEVEKSFEDLDDDNKYKILLSHRPEKIELYKKLPFDLILSGHAHGGQVRIPFILNGLLAPGQGWFPRYAGGLYEYEGKNHIVSRGVSFNPRLPRIFNPPEVVSISIVGE